MFPAKTERQPLPNIKTYNYQRRDEWSFLHYLSTEITTHKPVIVATKKENLHEVITHAYAMDKIVVVDFAANWCQPCQQFSVYFRLASAMMTNVEFIMVDCAMSWGTQHCKKYNVRQYPTILLFRPNRQRVEIEMHFNVEDLITEIEAFIPPKPATPQGVSDEKVPEQARDEL